MVSAPCLCGGARFEIDGVLSPTGVLDGDAETRRFRHIFVEQNPA